MRVAAVFMSLLLSGFLFPNISSSASPADTLRANLAALQRTSPGSGQERALQKRIIELVRKMGRTPPTPRAVRRHMARAEAFVESAKSKIGFRLAIREFRAVTRLAPWMAPAYYNLGVMQQKADQYDTARESYRMYLFAAPNARDAANVETQIFKLEALKEAAAAQASVRKRQAQARVAQERERQRQREQERLRRKQQEELKRFAKFGGIWCLKSGSNKRFCGSRMTVQGNRFEIKSSGRNTFSGGKWSGWAALIRGTFHPNGDITGTYGLGTSVSWKCGGRLAYGYFPMKGYWSPGGRRFTIIYTSPGAYDINSNCQFVDNSNSRFRRRTSSTNYTRP